MATTFTNFCCRSGGSNLNAGTRTGDTTVPASGASPLTYASGTWVQATGVFTVASGNPVTDGVVAGDFASVFPDAATVTPFVGRVTTRDATTITVSLTAKAGTAPVNGTTNTTLKIGGAWKGPNAAENFPFNFVQSTLTNAAGDLPRINFRNDANFSVTASIAHANAGPMVFQGFTTNYGDLGRATIDGGTSGTSYQIFAPTATSCLYVDLIFQNNGATGSASGVSAGASRTEFLRCVVNSVRGVGFALANSGMACIECEAYACNQSNTSGLAGFNGANGGQIFLRCIAHDNVGSNSSGFLNNGLSGVVFANCIADTNGQHGFFVTGNGHSLLLSCDAYNNTSNGIQLGGSNTAVGVYIENCNLVKNTGWGIFSSTTGTATLSAAIYNCGFGSGTQVNGSGDISVQTDVIVVGSITYASGVTPWVDPANGDFRITPGGGAANTGRGSFTQTAASYAGAVGYPDIGSAAHNDYKLPMSIQGVI